MPIALCRARSGVVGSKRFSVLGGNVADAWDVSYENYTIAEAAYGAEREPFFTEL
jgi:hypothetical protein